MKSITATIVALTLISKASVAAFTPNPHVSRSSVTQLNGLFDGMKDAFSAPALERSSLASERETPIDRWMGWNVQAEPEILSVSDAPANFVDAMEEANYVTSSLPKPMGIVFEENDEEFGGIFVLSLSEGGSAETDGTIKPGDQLVAVNTQKVAGNKFDDALGVIVDSETEMTKLVFFRGNEAQFYGPTGASKDWLDDFIAKE
eukprot:scaffold1465_cov222-Chaetoceros_neogracile.AAC.1